MLLTEVRTNYLNDHPHGVSETTKAYLTACIQCYSRFLERPAVTCDLERSAFNTYIDWMTDNRAWDTVRTQRSGILMLWRFAAENKLAEYPLRIRLPREKERLVRAWTVDEVAALRDYSASIPGCFRNSHMKIGPYLSSIISCGYETGFRLGDILTLRQSDLIQGPLTRVTITERKTGKIARRTLTPHTVSLIDLHVRRSNITAGPIWPLWGKREAFYRMIRKVVTQTGIRPGTFKYLRRTAATNVEQLRKGSATDFLNHSSPTVTKKSYVDLDQVDERLITVTPLPAA